MCVIWKKNLLFSTLILGSVFNDYVVFYGDIYRPTTHNDSWFNSLQLQKRENKHINELETPSFEVAHLL